MNTSARPGSRNSFFLVSALLALLLVAAPRTIAAEFNQPIDLAPGWNSIWLEVSPTDDAGQAMLVKDVFGNDDITVVARPVLPVGTAEFISDPDPQGSFNQEGWVVWHRGSPSGSTLTRIRGNQAYLVFNKGSSISFDLRGKVGFFQPTWRPGSYNLVGFGLLGTPTFADFFGNTGAADGVHPISKIFALDPTGHWQGVQSTDVMKKGVAYWVFAERNSTFAGPVKPLFDGTNGLSFGPGPGTLELRDSTNANIALTTRELTFTNISDSDRTVILWKRTPGTIGTDALSDELRLYRVLPDPDSLDYTLETGSPIDWRILAQTTPGTTRTVTIGAHRNWTSGHPTRENLYQIHVRLNKPNDFYYFWLPVEATRADLEGSSVNAANPSSSGLWVGEARLNRVTSIAESGAPVQDTTSALPMQILIHVDGAGNASLLSHVLFMQTKTADENVAAEPVLVVDETKIPFFEGILERDGKKIGRRLETAAYDLPRKFEVSTQPTELLTAIAESLSNNPDPSQVTNAQLETYVFGQATRPVGLVEDYHLSWPLEGGLGPGSIVRTASNAELSIDPFHRSNPFRHAFHPGHGTGLGIHRAITINLDDTNEDGLLRGTYSESLTGLTALGHPLVASGPITLRRVSDVNNLQ